MQSPGSIEYLCRGPINPHPPWGISFDLTSDEAVELMEFVRVYQDTIATVLSDTVPGIERGVIDKEADVSKREASEQKLLE
jgi:hypothetical protein